MNKIQTTASAAEALAAIALASTTPGLGSHGRSSTKHA